MASNELLDLSGANSHKNGFIKLVSKEYVSYENDKQACQKCKTAADQKQQCGIVSYKKHIFTSFPNPPPAAESEANVAAAFWWDVEVEED